jgi:iron(II)-dependent oxidoreductase
VKEWTSSLWGPDADQCTFGYPYRADDGREEVGAPPTMRRVHRGGSFLDPEGECTTFARTGVPPDTRFHGFGMRLARSPSA